MLGIFLFESTLWYIRCDSLDTKGYQEMKEGEDMLHMNNKVFGVLTVLLVLIILFCVKGTVMSRDKGRYDRQNKYYAVLEQEYLEKVNRLLKEEGVSNCGINLRWVADKEGSREYTVILHHRRLERMSGQEQINLTDRLTGAEFRDAACSFRYVIR